jgi:hypothetical protein
VLAHVWDSVTVIVINTSCNENQVFGEGSGLGVSYQASSYTIIKTKTENQLKRAVTVKMTLQNGLGRKGVYFVVLIVKHN